MRHPTHEEFHCPHPTPKDLVIFVSHTGNEDREGSWGLSALSCPVKVDLGRWPGLIQGSPKRSISYFTGARLQPGQVSWRLAVGKGLK